jgi:hypothetical protein
MTTLFRNKFLLILAGLLAAAAVAHGQQQTNPHIGYVFPAGGRQGAAIQVRVGGQYLANVTNAYISGPGVQATVVECIKPLAPQELKDLREKLKVLQDKRAAAQAPTNGGTSAAGQPHPALSAEERRMAAEIRDKIAKSQKLMVNPAIADIVILNVTIAPDAEPGERELRLGTPGALSQPLMFCVGQLPEFIKPAPPDDTDSPAANRPNPAAQKAVEPVESRVILPCVVNGQIMPGGVDRYRFEARKGQRLVIAVTARELIPYLADAVPGWFQAALSIYDPRGHEVAFADHFRFQPDPVLFYEVPADGQYVIQIRDSIYRGRDDFVYRISAGELPFLTGIFPLGGPAGAKTTVQVAGWNLPAAAQTEDDTDTAPGVYPLAVRADKWVSNRRPFAVDSLPECSSQPGNHSQYTAQTVTLPIIVNGRIETPGQWDVFRFNGRAGDELVAEVIARRLDSPLDSVIRLTDAAGKQLAFNDDFDDKGAGLQTQNADSYFRVKLPSGGPFFLFVGDAQHQGGPEYAYRLRLSPPRPDFALRIVPSSIAVRGGMSATLTVYALRKDGFTNDITLSLKDAPAGFALSGGVVPANQDQARLTLTAPALVGKEVFNLSVEGHALIQGHEVVRPGVPAEDMMQAFLYRHLVPSKELEVSLVDRPQFKMPFQLLQSGSVKIPSGGNAGVRIRTPGSSFTNNFQLELDAPPDGISIAAVSAAGTQTEITLRGDAAKIKPGVKGNLIVDILPRRPQVAPGKPQPPQSRVAVGVLPAIPFEIVAPKLLAK